MNRVNIYAFDIFYQWLKVNIDAAWFKVRNHEGEWLVAWVYEESVASNEVAEICGSEKGC
jgi:hypothetical protein